MRYFKATIICVTPEAISRCKGILNVYHPQMSSKRISEALKMQSLLQLNPSLRLRDSSLYNMLSDSYWANILFYFPKAAFDCCRFWF